MKKFFVFLCLLSCFSFIFSNFLFATDNTPPVISNVNAIDITDTKVCITWKTDEQVYGHIHYGTTTEYTNSYPFENYGIYYSTSLSGLTPGTLYHYKIVAADSSSNQSQSADFTFTTKSPPDTIPPMISNINAIDVTDTAARLVWDTDEAATSGYYYGTTTNYSISTMYWEYVSSHSIYLTELTPGTQYYFKVASYDCFNNLSESADFTFTTKSPPDTTPPVISNIKVEDVTASVARFVWDTDEAATTVVHIYDLVTVGPSYDEFRYVTSHSKMISFSLEPNTEYHYKVLSSDCFGNQSESEYLTFTTLPQSYCPSSGEDQSNGWIARVKVRDLINQSDASGYSDFSSLTANLISGEISNISLTSESNSSYWKIWIDYNGDGDFDDDGEEIFSGAGGTTVNGSFVVPASASETNTRIRIIMKYDGSPSSPCGSFEYGEVEDYSVNIKKVVPGDYNGDGKPDLIGYASNGYTRLLKSDGTRFVVQPWESAYAGYGKQLVADFNGDGLTDILLMEYIHSTLYVSDGEKMVFKSYEGDTPVGYYYYLGDYNGDGKADLIGYAPAGYTRLLKGDESGIIVQPWESAYSGYSKQFVADFNGDGLTDILLMEYIHSTLYVSDGEKMVFKSYEGDTPVGYYYHLGDYNGDRKADLIGYAPAGYTRLLKGDESGIIVQPWESAYAGYSKQFVADFNGDGLTDILLMEYTHSALYVSDGEKMVFKSYEGDTPVGYNYYLGDYNGDGKTDLIGYAPAGYTRLLKGDDSGIIVQPWESAYAGYSKQFVADFNGDGLTDILLMEGLHRTLYLSDGNKMVFSSYDGDTPIGYIYHLGTKIQ